MGPEESGQRSGQIADGFAGVRDTEPTVSPADLKTFLNSTARFFTRPVSIRNLTIETLTPDKLHEQWAFIKSGAEQILRKVGRHTDWIPEDLYAALRYPEASHLILWMAVRNSKVLGWIAGHPQRDQYGRVEFFLWTGWDIPIRERAPDDDVPGARDQLIDYIKMWAKSQGCYRLACMSPRALEQIGFIKGHTTYYMPL